MLLLLLSLRFLDHVCELVVLRLAGHVAACTAGDIVSVTGGMFGRGGGEGGEGDSEGLVGGGVGRRSGV